MANEIFIIDDEEDMIRNAEDLLKMEGYAVRSFTNPLDGLNSMEQKLPDLLILDIRMHPIDGFEVCRKIKANPKLQSLPVIMVSIKNQETDVITGLELGADDYIRKPYQKGELLARIRTTLRRNKPHFEPQKPTKITVGSFELDPSNYSAVVDGKKLDLRPKEFELLNFFLANEGRVLLHKKILENVWHSSSTSNTPTLNFHVVQLRKKLKNYGKCLKSLKGIGYRFELAEATS